MGGQEKVTEESGLVEGPPRAVRPGPATQKLPVPNAWMAYGLALLLTALTVLVRFWVGDGSEQPPVFLLFVVPIVLSAVLGGLGPGLVATGLSSLALNWFFVAPVGTFAVSSGIEFAQLCILVGLGVIIALLIQGLRSAMKRAVEAEHRLIEEKFRATLENAAVGISHADIHGNWLLVNRKLCEMLGYAEAELLGRNLRDFTPPEDVPKDWELYQRMMRGELPSYRIEKRYICRDGTLLWTELNRSPFLSGDPPYSINVVVDISARKAAEARLQENRAELEAILNSINDGVVVFDLQGRVIEVNPAAAAMIGAPAGDLRRSLREFATVFQVLTMEGTVLPIDQWPLSRVLRGETFSNMEVEVRNLVSSHVFIGSFSGTQVSNPAGQPVLGVYTVRDISEAKQAQEAIRTAHARLNTMLENMQDGFVLFDRTWHYVSVNAAAARMLRTRPENLLGRNVWESYPEAVHTPAWPEFHRAVEQQVSVQFEHYYPPLQRWFEHRAHPAPEGLALFFSDITERKHAEEELRRANTLLEERVQERTAKLRDTIAELEHFSYTITHDMRAPLRSMEAFSTILLSEYGAQLDDAGRDFVRRIVQSSTRMDALITDALNYNKIVRAQMELEPIDVKHLLEGMLDSYVELQPPHARIDIASSIPLVMGNQAGLTQCFSNLLNNAVKFVRPGLTPHVRIRAECRPAGNSNGASGSRVRLWFEDNGIGIPASQFQKIFIMFQRVDPKYDGTGIGLALVKKVVERMKGTVGVESREGNGSRFWVELAAAPDSC